MGFVTLLNVWGRKLQVATDNTLSINICYYPELIDMYPDEINPFYFKKCYIILWLFDTIDLYRTSSCYLV